MAEFKNSFLRSKMNKDLDDRLIPNGEYRDAQNISVGKSEADDIGALETILGNVISTDFGLIPNNLEIIGYKSIDNDGRIIVFLTNYNDTSNNPVLATSADSCYIYEFTPTSGYDLLVSGHFLNFSKNSLITGISVIEDLLFWTDNRNQPRKINITTAKNNSSYYATESDISVAKYNPYEAINVLNKTSQVTEGITGVLTKTYNSDGGFTGVNTIVLHDYGQNQYLIDWLAIYGSGVVQVTSGGVTIATDGVTPVTVTSQTLSTNQQVVFNTTVTVIDDQALVFTLPSQSTTITVPDGSNINLGMAIVEYGNTSVGPASYLYVKAKFGLSNGKEAIVANQAINGVVSGDTIYFLETTMTGEEITYNFNNGSAATWPGDPDYLESKFVRLSYRFEFDDGEYSIMAPFTQIAFIPKQKGYFLANQEDEAYKSTIVEFMENGVQDIDLHVTFPDDLGNVGISANSSYKIKSLDILYKESDGLTVKVLDTISYDEWANPVGIPTSLIYKQGGTGYNINESNRSVTGGTGSGLEVETRVGGGSVQDIIIQQYGNGYTNGDNVTITSAIGGTGAVFEVVVDTNIYTYNYQSRKPFRTLPQNQTTRVYDKVPVKALAQETSGNRIIYGNFYDKYTPPAYLDYKVGIGPKLLTLGYDNWAEYPNHSVKQNRNYQVGFVLADKFGRQSDVILSSITTTNTTEAASGIVYGGDTIFSPYNDQDENQNNPIRNWFGDALTIDISSQISSGTANDTPDSTTGEPGLYASIIGNGFNIYGNDVSFSDYSIFRYNEGAVNASTVVNLTAPTSDIEVGMIVTQVSSGGVVGAHYGTVAAVGSGDVSIVHLSSAQTISDKTELTFTSPTKKVYNFLVNGQGPSDVPTVGSYLRGEYKDFVKVLSVHKAVPETNEAVGTPGGPVNTIQLKNINYNIKKYDIITGVTAPGTRTVSGNPLYYSSQGGADMKTVTGTVTYTDGDTITYTPATGASTTTTNNNIVTATTALTLPNPGNDDILIGMKLTGTGVPADLYITGKTDAENFTLSKSVSLAANINPITYSTLDYYTIICDGQINTEIYSNSTANPDTNYAYTLNPVGWYSYKVVVKQQEQDYYNVYLPGILNGFPVLTTPLIPSNTGEQNKVANIVLINDNINKVPRDLAEVGPDQKQFRSSVELYGRVNNTMTTGTANNVQYYPFALPTSLDTTSIISHTVVSISTAEESGMVYGNLASTGGKENLYEVDSNPLIGRLSTTNGSTNPIGVISTAVTNTNMTPFLAIYETQPQESVLDIFWETPTVGLISDLNSSILSNFNGAVGWQSYTWTLLESATATTTFISNLQPLDSSGNALNNTSISSFSATDLNGTDVSSQLEIVSNGGDGTVSNPIKYDFKTKTGDFVYNESTNARNYLLTMVVNNLETNEISAPLTISGGLTNVAPVITSTINPITNNMGTSGIIATYVGNNGAIDVFYFRQELKWSVSGTNVAGNFTMDPDTGELTQSGSAPSGTYSLTIKLEDANGNLSNGSLSVTATQGVTISAATVGYVFYATPTLNALQACPAGGAQAPDCGTVTYYSQSALVGGYPPAGAEIRTGPNGSGSPLAAAGYYTLNCSTGAARYYMQIDNSNGLVAGGFPASCGA